MTNKRLFLLVGFLLLLEWILPVERASSQSQHSEPVRVISLSMAGDDRANAVAFSPDGKYLAVAASSGIHLFDPQTLSQKEFFSTGAWVRTLAISPDGAFLAAGLSTHTAHLLQFPTLKPVHEFEDLSGWVRSIVFTPDGQFMAAAAGDAVHLWNRAEGTVALTIENLAGIRALAISPDGGTVAVGLQDNSIQLRSLSDGSLSKILLGHEGWIRCLAFSPDGTQLASGAFDATARLWDVSSGQLLHTLSDHQSSVLGIVFSPDGTTLATGSVDQTVRLWNSSDGTLLRTFVGHSGFVYSVAFSPDGDVLASGANDNSVRLWNLNSTSDLVREPPSTPSDCRICHHPPNNTNPVAVIDVRCDACHSGGLGVNWCPFFSRSDSETSELEIHTASREQIGVPIPGRALAVTIFSPANGEAVYSNASHVAPLQVTGKVESSNLTLDKINVQLEVWTGTQMLSTLTQPLKPDGQFAFNLGVNPNGYMLRINDPAAPFNCAYCHDDYYVQAYVPAGDIRLLVRATTFDGDQASDERWIITDVNKTLPLEVSLTDADSGEPVAGLTVHAVTRLYEWRGRTSTALSDEYGIANLSLEVLSQSPTVYKIEIPNQVVDGIFYSAQDTGTLTVDPETAQLAMMEFKVNSRKGQIHGTLNFDVDSPVVVWAVQRPAGQAFQVQSNADGRFSFNDLPIATYAVFADPAMMAHQSLTATYVTADLLRSPESSVELDAKTAVMLFAGRVTGSEGEWLPFAWLSASDRSVVPADIRSGNWTISGQQAQAEAWVATAPGYYSQAVGSLQSETIVTLNRRSDTESIPWGLGEITVPSDTIVKVSPGKIDFDSGWIWGMNSGNEPIVLRTDEAEIRLSFGQFALERPAGETAWFYLFDGQAKLHHLGSGNLISLEAGQMIPLLESSNFSPMPYLPSVLPVLRSLTNMSVSPYWEPSAAEKIQDLSLQSGVILAQFVTLITYFIAVISLVGIAWWAVRWMSKHQRSPGEKNETK